MRPTSILGMRQTPFLAMRQTPLLAMRQTPLFAMRQTQPMLRPVPREEHSAHTISQRIRTLKKIPPELIPLGVVLLVALAAAGYSIGRKLVTDKQLRLSRSGGISTKGTSQGDPAQH